MKGKACINCDMDIKKLIGQKIKERRKQLGLTQEELAELLGVTWSAVSKWEIGDRRPSDKLLQKLAKVLKVSTSYFLEEKPKWDANAEFLPGKIIPIPIYGEAQAGSFGGYMEITPERYFPTHEAMLHGLPPERVFWIEVSGHSMEPQYYPGDLILVADPSWWEFREGEPVLVVNGDGELTVKYYHYDKENRQIILQPENPAYFPIVIPEKELNQQGHIFFPILGYFRGKKN